MGFFDEIISLFGEDEIDTSFKIECLGRGAVVVGGYKKILKLSEGEIQLSYKKDGKIIIRGAKLYIKKLEESEVVVAGKILEIQFAEE